MPPQTIGMTRSTFPLESLSAEERIALIGRLWDSLEPSAAAPVTPELAAELVRREIEADTTPAAGVPWAELRADLQSKLP